MREIELKPSRWLGLLLLGMTALALTSIQLAVLPGAIKLALGMAVVGLSIRGWRRAVPMAGLRLAAGDRLQMRDDRAEWRDVEIQGDSFVSTALIVLRFRPADGPLQTLALLPDSADADDLRRLRVLLRWARRTRSDTSSPGAG